MTDKTKRIILIAAGVLLCAALVVGIVSRLAAVPMPIDPAIPDDTPKTKDPVVNISDPEVKVDSKTDGERHDLGRDADSSGTEQTIQGTPTKPDAPEHPGKTEKNHVPDDVPEADRNKETPPTYKPEQTEMKPQPTECALPGFVDSKNEEKTERNAGYLVVSQSGGGMLRQGTREGIRRTPANRGMRAHRVVKGLDISEDVCHGLCP